jgi:hypothetical protein
MSELSERTVIHCIKLLPGGRIEVERAEQVLRGDEVIHSRTVAQALDPGQDLSGLALEPEVLAVAAAVWTPAQIEDAIAAMLEAMRAGHAVLQAAERDAEAALEATRADNAAKELEQQQAHAAEMLAAEQALDTKLAETHAVRLLAEQRRKEEIAAASAENARALEGVARSNEALFAATRALDAERQVLAGRDEQVTRERAALFEQRQILRRQRPQLDALMNELEAEERRGSGA